MKSKFILLVIFLLFSCSASSNEQLEEKINQLNLYSQELIGLSLSSFSVLSQFNAGGEFIPRARYDEKMSINSYAELIEKGYIQIEFHDGIPGGELKGQEFAWISLTGKGLHLTNYLKK